VGSEKGLEPLAHAPAEAATSDAKATGEEVRRIWTHGAEPSTSEGSTVPGVHLCPDSAPRSRSLSPGSVCTTRPGCLSTRI
jgi:hypothetical protein